MPPKTRRIAIMGFRSVGKSSLTIQFVENQFVDSYDPTIENTFSKTFKVRGQDYILQLVDTAGQDEYSILPQSYSMNIDGYVLVYSVTSPKSLDVVQVIHEKLLDKTGKMNLPLVLVGNKRDLRMERVISPEDGKKLADSWKAAFLEASAKENQNRRGRRPRRFRFMDDEFRGHYATLTPINYESPIKVVDIFQTIITEIEKADGNIQEKGGCILQ